MACGCVLHQAIVSLFTLCSYVHNVPDLCTNKFMCTQRSRFVYKQVWFALSLANCLERPSQLECSYFVHLLQRKLGGVTKSKLVYVIHVCVSLEVDLMLQVIKGYELSVGVLLHISYRRRDIDHGSLELAVSSTNHPRQPLTCNEIPRQGDRGDV